MTTEIGPEIGDDGNPGKAAVRKLAKSCVGFPEN